MRYNKDIVFLVHLDHIPLLVFHLRRISHSKLRMQETHLKSVMVIFDKILKIQGAFQGLKIVFRETLDTWESPKNHTKIRAYVITQISHCLVTIPTYLCLFSIYKGFPTTKLAGKKHA